MILASLKGGIDFIFRFVEIDQEVHPLDDVERIASSASTQHIYTTVDRFSVVAADDNVIASPSKDRASNLRRCSRQVP